jgi:hypothetical protein
MIFKEKKTRFDRVSHSSRKISWDEKEYESFHKNYLGIAIYFATNKSIRFKIKDRNLNESSAMEAMFESFCELTNYNKTSKENDILIRNIIKRNCNRCVMHQLIYFGYIKNKGTIFFPTEFVKWEEFFIDRSSCNSSKISKKEIEDSLDEHAFSRIEKSVILEFLEGLYQREIAQKIGVSQPFVHKILNRIFKKLNIDQKKD